MAAGENLRAGEGDADLDWPAVAARAGRRGGGGFLSSIMLCPKPRFSFGWFVLACAAVISALRAAEPLNVVVLYADDWRHDTLGCAGNPIVKTPNIDRMARDGVRFTH